MQQLSPVIIKLKRRGNSGYFHFTVPVAFAMKNNWTDGMLFMAQDTQMGILFTPLARYPLQVTWKY